LPSTGLTSDDRLSIRDLLARYARCLDSGDLDGYVSLFTHAPVGAAAEYLDECIKQDGR
jgi:3-phenylpropionate/cinnamic acid dioxygenase small subunit